MSKISSTTIVTIRLVLRYGPFVTVRDCTLLRSDTSPVKDRLLPMVDKIRELSLYACGNTLKRMEIHEGARPMLFPQVIMVKAGLPEIIELQRLGWTYIKP